MNALVYVDIDQGIYKGKLKNALNEKRKKLFGFSFSINIANFEAFLWTKKLISNLFFLKSVKWMGWSNFVNCIYYLAFIVVCFQFQVSTRGIFSYDGTGEF